MNQIFEKHAEKFLLSMYIMQWATGNKSAVSAVAQRGPIHQVLRHFWKFLDGRGNKGFMHNSPTVAMRYCVILHSFPCRKVFFTEDDVTYSKKAVHCILWRSKHLPTYKTRSRIAALIQIYFIVVSVKYDVPICSDIRFSNQGRALNVTSTERSFSRLP